MNSVPSSALIREPSPPLFVLVGGSWVGVEVLGSLLSEPPVPPVTVLFLGFITVKYTGTTTAAVINARAIAARTQMRGLLWKGFDFVAVKVPESAGSFSRTPASRGAEFTAELLVIYESRGVDVPSEGARYGAAGGRRGSLKMGRSGVSGRFGSDLRESGWSSESGWWAMSGPGSMGAGATGRRWACLEGGVKW